MLAEENNGLNDIDHLAFFQPLQNDIAVFCSPLNKDLIGFTPRLASIPVYREFYFFALENFLIWFIMIIYYCNFLQ